MKIKFNYFFFILTAVLPLGTGTLATLIWWPAIYSHYWEVIMSPTANIVVGFILVFVMAWFAAAYSGVPWLAVIKKDNIMFYRLFKRKLIITYKNVKRLEILSKKLPVETNKNSLGNLVFTMENGCKYVVVAVPHYVSIELKKKLGNIVEEYYRKLTDEEFDRYAVGKKK